MKPILIQAIMKNRRKGRPVPELDDKIYTDHHTPLAKFIFWGLAAIILLSLLLA